MTQETPSTPLADTELVYLADSGLELANPADDVRGLAVVTPYGIRLGEVGDLLVDRHERRARILSVLSGGILGLGATERLVPVEVVSRVDDRVHVDRSLVDEVRRGRDDGDAPPFADVYERYGVVPFWSADHADAAFLRP